MTLRRQLRQGLLLGLLLWRIQMRMLWNQTVRSRRPLALLGAGAAVLLILAWWSQQVFVLMVGAAAASRVQVPFPPDRVLGLIFIAYSAFLIFSGLLFTVNALLLNPDLELLLAAPWPVEAVVIGRTFSQLVRLLVISLLVILPTLILLPVLLGRPVASAGLLVILAVYPVIPLMLVTLLTLYAIRVVPPNRGREVITAVSLLLALGVNVVNVLVNPAFQGRAPGYHVPRGVPDLPAAASPWLPFGWAGRGAAAALGGDLGGWLNWTAVLLAASTAALMIGARLGGRVYVAGWIQTAQRNRRRRRAPAASSNALRLPGLTATATALVLKDWRLRRRDLSQLTRVLMPMAFLGLFLLLRSRPLFDLVHSVGRGPLAALIALAPAWLLLIALTSTLGLSAVSLEGKAVWVYLASPNSTRELLSAKCWSVGLPALAVGLALGAALEALVRPGLVWAAAGLGLLLVAGAGLTSLMVAIGTLWARFDWTDARRMVHPAAGLLGSLIQMMATAMIALLAIGSIIVAAPLRLPLLPAFLMAMTIGSGVLLVVTFGALVLAAQRLRELQV